MRVIRDRPGRALRTDPASLVSRLRLRRLVERGPDGSAIVKGRALGARSRSDGEAALDHHRPARQWLAKRLSDGPPLAQPDPPHGLQLWLGQHLRRRHLQRASQSLDVVEREVPLTPLDAADIGAMKPGLRCQAFLTEPQLQPPAPHVVGHDASKA